MSYKALLLEDDVVISNEIRDFLKSRDIYCDIVYDGNLFFKQIKAEEYDVYLLDVNVPKMNGIEVCKTIRLTDKTTPIIMLTAFGEIEDKKEAFQFGADDYLVKPFHLEELLIRFHSLLRRKIQPQLNENIIEIADLKINMDEKQVTKNESVIKLTPQEFKLLSILAMAKGRVLSKQQIAEKLWDYHIETNENTIEVYINFLRNKIDKPFKTNLLQTKVGFGYYLKSE